MMNCEERLRNSRYVIKEEALDIMNDELRRKISKQQTCHKGRSFGYHG